MLLQFLHLKANFKRPCQSKNILAFSKLRCTNKKAVNVTRKQIKQSSPVILEAFKPVDVQDSNLRLRIQILPDRPIDLINKPERNIKINKKISMPKKYVHKINK